MLEPQTGASIRMSCLVFKPKTATPENPAPLIVTSHGYLNNREMQDINAVEWARRGFVVIAMDATNHGNSAYYGSSPSYGMTAFVEYGYKLPYVDKTKVGVTGHSMGTLASNATAAYYGNLGRVAFAAAKAAGKTDEEAKAADDAANKVSAVLSVASAITTAATPQQTGGYGTKTSVGVIAPMFDEFAFRQAGKYTGTNAAIPVNDKNRANKMKYEWLPKDFASSPNISLLIQQVYPAFATTDRHTVPLLGEPGYDASLVVPASNPIIKIPVEAVKSGVFYTSAGETALSHTNPAETPFRVLYPQYEIHPWAHFSLSSSAAGSNFWYAAFGLSTNAKYINEGSQVWWLKEGFNLLEMIGFFLFVLAFADVVLTIPFFSKIKNRQKIPATAGEPAVQAASAELRPIEAQPIEPKLIEPKLMEPTKLKGWKKHIPFWLGGILTSLIAGFSIRFFTTGTYNFGNTLFPTSSLYPQVTTNYVSVWAVASGIIALLIFTAFWIFFGRKRGERPFELFKTSVGSVLRSALAAIVIVATSYLIVLFAETVFITDFRIWSFAVKTFEITKIATILRYAIIFAVFYVINAFLNATNRFKNVPEWLSTAICAFFNIFGIVLVFAIQYGVFFGTGAMWHWDAAINYIVLFPIVPILVIAAIFARKFYLKTGNIWFAGFVNALLFTMITVANTSTAFAYILF